MSSTAGDVEAILVFGSWAKLRSFEHASCKKQTTHLKERCKKQWWTQVHTANKRYHTCDLTSPRVAQCSVVVLTFEAAFTPCRPLDLLRAPSGGSQINSKQLGSNERGMQPPGGPLQHVRHLFLPICNPSSTATPVPIQDVFLCLLQGPLLSNLAAAMCRAQGPPQALVVAAAELSQLVPSLAYVG
jgi:hypothetical protein